MAQENRPGDDFVSLQDVPEGTKVKLADGVIAEVTANPRDGGWLFIKFIEYPGDPSRVGKDDMVFCADVLGVA